MDLSRSCSSTARPPPGEFEWANLAAALGPGYRCILPDLRGHGRSEFRPTATTGDVVRADLRYLIEHLDLGRPHIVGFSYGAEIALTLELDNPGTARSLVLISPGTGRPSDYRAPRLEHLHRSWPFALRRLHEATHGPEHWRDLVTAMHEDSVSWPELSDDTLAGIACPVLLMAGERDELDASAAGPAVRASQSAGPVCRDRGRGAFGPPEVPRYGQGSHR